MPRDAPPTSSLQGRISCLVTEALQSFQEIADLPRSAAGKVQQFKRSVRNFVKNQDLIGLIAMAQLTQREPRSLQRCCQHPEIPRALLQQSVFQAGQDGSKRPQAEYVEQHDDGGALFPGGIRARK